MIGVSSGFVAHIETGRTLPSVSTCKKLAHALGVHEPEILSAAGYLSDGHERADVNSWSRS
jgi:transcriptional regulator with XRE-family HTH domain